MKSKCTYSPGHKVVRDYADGGVVEWAKGLVGMGKKGEDKPAPPKEGTVTRKGDTVQVQPGNTEGALRSQRKRQMDALGLKDGGKVSKKAKPNPNAPLGQGGRFAALAAKTSPAIAAAAGRKKYGAKKMAQLAAKGRKG